MSQIKTRSTVIVLKKQYARVIIAIKAAKFARFARDIRRRRKKAPDSSAQVLQSAPMYTVISCVHLPSTSGQLPRKHGGNLQDQKQTVTITNEPDVFKAYVHWLYFGTIPRLTNDDSITSAGSDYNTLAKLYVVEEESMDTCFKNVVIGNFTAVSARSYKGHQIYPGARSIPIIYEGTTKDSQMRRLIADMYSNHASYK